MPLKCWLRCLAASCETCVPSSFLSPPPRLSLTGMCVFSSPIRALGRSLKESNRDEYFMVLIDSC